MALDPNKTLKEQIRVKFLSPSAIMIYRKDKGEYFRKYVMHERDPQTRPMAVGSAFDCFVKAEIHSRFYGPGSDPNYEFSALFENAVEEHNRVQALVDGKVVYDRYLAQGGLADLMLELKGATTVKMEFDLKDVIDGVPLFGKPDLFYIDKVGNDRVHDWKVNGFLSKMSPKKGYYGYKERGMPFEDRYVDGINVDRPLEGIDPTWAAQLSTYGWMVGLPVGGSLVGSVHQLTGPACRLTRYAAVTGREFQLALMEAYKECWEWIQNVTEDECQFMAIAT